jgi:cytochrome c oxidase cbb3-type subunit III
MNQEYKKQDENMATEVSESKISEHDYDGIKELDNVMPNWLVFVFIITIFFSMIYVIHYFGYPENGKDQVSEYTNAVEEYNQQFAGKDKSGGTKNVAEMIAAGKKLFNEKGCIACHGSAGEGNAVGPNLTDKFWINGCSEAEIANVIAEGRPLKGMTPYKNVMSETQIKNLTAFLLGELQGSNPANGKAPQGEECKAK